MSKIFSFNEDRSGTFLDGVSGDVGVNTNGEWAKTEKGQVWRGNGVDSFITLDSSITLSRNSATIELWFTLASFPTSAAALFGNGSATYSYLRMINTGVIRLESDTNADFWFLDPSFAANKNEWYHMIIVADEGTVNTYINGVLVQTANPLDDITIDRLANDSANQWHGNIGKVTFWNTPITLNEISKLYSEFLNASPITRAIHG